jgi:hypothetical protein
MSSDPNKLVLLGGAGRLPLQGYKRASSLAYQSEAMGPVASFRTAANSSHIQGGPAGQIKGDADETVSQQLWLLAIVCLLRCCEGLG